MLPGSLGMVGLSTRFFVGGALALLSACAGSSLTQGDDSASFGPGGNGSATATDTDSGTLTSGGVGTESMSGPMGEAGVGDGPNCIDDDGDGYGTDCASGTDCDDSDPDINPGTAESCNGIDDNCDGQIDNGCECPDDTVSNNCNSPTDLGELSVGDSVLSVVGNVPQENGLDWYVVSFPAPMRPGEGMPSVQFALNEDEAFVFDMVAEQCSSAGAPCTSGPETGIGLTSWSFVDDDPGCCNPPTDSMVPWPAPIYIRVYRTTPGESCATYQLQVTR